LSWRDRTLFNCKLRDIRSQLNYLEKLSDDDLIIFGYEIEELSICARSLESTLKSTQRRPSGLRWAFWEKQRVDALLKSVRDAHMAFYLKLNIVMIEKSAVWDSRRSWAKRGNENSPPTPMHAEHGELAPPRLYIHFIERRVEHASTPTISMDIQNILSSAEQLLGSEVKIVPFRGGGFYIVEERGLFGLDHKEIQATKERVRDVAATLHQSDPAIRELVSQRTGIAHCMGFTSNDMCVIDRFKPVNVAPCDRSAIGPRLCNFSSIPAAG